MRPVLRWIVLVGAIAALGGGAYATRDRWRASWVKFTQPAVPVSTVRPDAANFESDGRRQQQLGVRIATVARSTTALPIRVTANIRLDETALSDVNVKLDGWIRDLHVDATGTQVEKGQPLLTLYSPDVIAAEREYLLALRQRDEMRGSIVPGASAQADELVAAVRRRFQLWDLPPELLAKLEQTHEVPSTVPIVSPASGYVMEKIAVAGMHVTSGQTLYRLADLSRVWVEAEVPERDAAALRMGTVGEITIAAFPGRKLRARLMHVHPMFESETRTVRARFELDNPGGRLKPGMYADVEIQRPSTSSLVVPADAVLDTGREQIVFVAEGEGHFTPRRVQVGARGSDTIEIVSGVQEGERIAASAVFFLDADTQLRSGLSAYEQAPSSQSDAAAARLAVTLTTDPTPARRGQNTFHAVVKDAAGVPIADADVTLQFFMAAMPSMNMPAMRSSVRLAPAGGGAYRGTGEILTPGTWEVTAIVERAGQRIGTSQTTLIAK